MRSFTLVALLIFCCISLAQAAINHQYNPDWTPHRTCTKETRFFKNYCLEIMELASTQNQHPKNTLLLVSGLFQNTNAWDLMPEYQISMARYLRDKFNARIFVLHTRGISGSNYIEQTNLDDLAIDDVDAAIKFVIKKTSNHPIIIGHSQGAIITQAYIAGLSRCGLENNCFLKDAVKKRSSQIRAVGLIGGNPTLTTDRRDNFLQPLSRLGQSKTIQYLLKSWDMIDVEKITKYTGMASFLEIWDNTYVIKNVSQAARVALWQRSVEATTGAVLVQFANAIKNKDLTTRGGKSYKKALKNIILPIYQLAMEDDKLSPPISTKTAFDLIGSHLKEFEVLPHRGHLDFQMSKALHPDLDKLMKYLTKF